MKAKDELFAVNRELLEKGIFRPQRHNMRGCLFWMLVSVFCSTHLFYWSVEIFLVRKFDQSCGLYLLETTWFMAWSGFYLLAMVCKLLFAVSAMVSPRTLLNRPRQKCQHRCFNGLMISATCVLGSVLFIDPCAYLLSRIMTFTCHEVRREDMQLDHMTRLIQVMIGICLLVLAFCMCFDKSEKVEIENRVLKAKVLLTKAGVTFDQNQNSTKASDWSNCPLCLEKYSASCEVVELKCHPNHVFHRNCLYHYLDNFECIHTPRCPVCLERLEIEFTH